ncbi:hypothetical protein M5E87_01555 [Flavonifractor plautii]|nr:hypothetical protein M5E87_01555 [Flavonifractor plautii]
MTRETWPRRAHYDFFTPMSDPFYTLTFPVDVTPLRAWCKGRSLPFTRPWCSPSPRPWRRWTPSTTRIGTG